MNNIELVDVLNAADDLLEYFTGLGFRYSELTMRYFLHLTI